MEILMATSNHALFKMAGSVFALLFCALASPGTRASDCDPSLPEARILGGASFERSAACEGLARAQRFFFAHGFSPQLHGRPITFKFSAVVRIPCLERDAGPACVGPRVAGLFDADQALIVSTTADDPWMRSADRDYFKLPYDKELYTSVLAHEATHAINKQFYSFDPDQHGPDEYIAYASQLWSMDPMMRAQVLAKYDPQRFTFRTELNINDITHFMDPHGFGVMSYRHFLTPAGGEAMMHRIYSGAYRPPTME
jgi:hypothetical protein